MLWIALEGEEEEEEEEDLVHTYTVHKNSHPIPLLQPLMCMVRWYDILGLNCVLCTLVSPLLVSHTHRCPSSEEHTPRPPLSDTSIHRSWGGRSGGEGGSKAVREGGGREGGGKMEARKGE